MINYTFLLIGLIYTTVLPGFVVTELLLGKLAFWKKIPLYLILSVIVSTVFTYLAALIFGFNRQTILWSFVVFAILFVCVICKNRYSFLKGIQKTWPIIVVGMIIYAAYFTALYPAIFQFHNGYFIMGGPNWQDTAMHLSIIQSLTQGNFPPVAPYFSGAQLSYYYFSDFHAAIVSTMFGGFFPEALVLINPFLAATFFFSVFALAYEITKRKLLSIISAVAAVMYGNFGFVNLIHDMITRKQSYTTLLTSNSYNFDKLYLQMAPMADYFLQNRPMMVGLPALVVAILLLLRSKKFDSKYSLRILIAGTITAALLKFQLFGFVLSWAFFGIYFFLNLILKKMKIKNALRYLLIFGLPSLGFGLFFASVKVESRTIINIFLDTFSWGPWQNHTPIWYMYFLLENLGLGLLVFVIGIFTKRTWGLTNMLAIYMLSFVALVIPLSMKFTIYEFDMLKFFYYLVPLLCVASAFIFSTFKRTKTAVLIFGLVVLISSLTSVNMLVHSYLNKTQGYSSGDYLAGMWIIDNTPQKSVFVTMPTVHSAVADIGGRIRIISYINWPYSHGFNSGEDNVFSRVTDVEYVYKTGDISQVKLKYGAQYLFYGTDESGQFPEVEKLFDNSKNLKLIYNQGGIKIYAIF